MRYICHTRCADSNDRKSYREGPVELTERQVARLRDVGLIRYFQLEEDVNSPEAQAKQEQTQEAEADREQATQGMLRKQAKENRAGYINELQERFARAGEPDDERQEVPAFQHGKKLEGDPGVA